MPASAGQASRPGGSIDHAIAIRSSSPASPIDSRDSRDSEAENSRDSEAEDSSVWEGFSTGDKAHEDKAPSDSDSDNDSDDEVIPNPPISFLSATIQDLQNAVNA